MEAVGIATEVVAAVVELVTFATHVAEIVVVDVLDVAVVDLYVVAAVVVAV